MLPVSRRGFFGASAGLLLSPRASAAPPKTPAALIHGESRRANITDALRLIDREITAKLRNKKVVVIKPNCVSTNKQLAATHADALHGILDYLETRWKGPVVIAESSAGYSPEAFDNFGYGEAARQHPKLKPSLVCLNEEGLYETIQLLNGDLHIQPVRLAKRLLDPDAFVISAAMPKTHNTVIATLNIKNMTLGAPLRSKRGENPRWNDKRVYHGGIRQTHYDMLLTAQRMAGNWGLGVIDGFEGMEGNGPSQGTPVNSRMAIVSPDMVASDRIGVEAMGINPEWLGYLNYCDKAGVGVYDRNKIELRGDSVESVKKTYRMHADIERELQWMGPLTELPPKLG